MMFRDLLRLRREDPAFRAQRVGGVDGAIVAPWAFALRFFDDAGDRLLLVNLGPDLDLRSAPEPLLAAPAGGGWQVIWSSEDPRYGGGGTPAVEADGWRLLGESAVVLAPRGEPAADYVV